MSGRPLVHIEIPAADPKSAARFYADVFDWDIQHMDEMSYTLFESGNVAGGFPAVDDKLNKPGNVLVYVESPDIDADLKKIAALGGKMLHPKSEIPGFGWWAAFSDPTGNTIGLYTALKRD